MYYFNFVRIDIQVITSPEIRKYRKELEKGEKLSFFVVDNFKMKLRVSHKKNSLIAHKKRSF